MREYARRLACITTHPARVDVLGLTELEARMHMLLTRIQAEYREMPGLRLTVAQVQRLCGGDGPACAAVLDLLVEERFLIRRTDGSYTRLTDGPRLRPV